MSRAKAAKDPRALAEELVEARLEGRAATLEGLFQGSADDYGYGPAIGVAEVIRGQRLSAAAYDRLVNARDSRGEPVEDALALAEEACLDAGFLIGLAVGRRLAGR